MIAGADKLKSLSDEQKPTVAIITNLLCEKLAVDSLIERKTTYIRYKTEGDSNVYTIGYIGSVKVISVKLPMVGWELQAKISSGSITTRLLGMCFSYYDICTKSLVAFWCYILSGAFVHLVFPFLGF